MAKTSDGRFRLKLMVAVAGVSMLGTAIAACCGLLLARVELEERLINGQADNLASIVMSLKLPVSSPRLLRHLKQVSSCEIVVTGPGGTLGTTFQDMNETEMPLPTDVSCTFQGKDYRVAARRLGGDVWLWLFLPKEVFIDSLRQSYRTIGTLAALAAVLALVLAVVIANAYVRLYAKARDMDRRLAKAQQSAMAGKMSASVVHELRNPLSGIKMNAQLLAEEIPPESSAGEPLQMILGEIDRIDTFLKGLTEVKDTDITEPKRVELNELLNQIITLLSPRAKQEGVELVLAKDPEFPSSLLTPCPEVPMRQILVNLLVNGIEASPERGTVALRVEVKGGRLIFEISDEGPGVHPSDGEDIFAPFVSSKAGGSGLGLHISRQLADKYQGTLSWKNLPVRGAMFTLSFELA